MDPMGLLFVAAGLFTAAGGFFDWDWFMNNRRARLLSRLITRSGARIFYVLIGVVLVVVGALAAAGVIHSS